MISSNGLTHHPWCLQGGHVAFVIRFWHNTIAYIYAYSLQGPALAHLTQHITHGSSIACTFYARSVHCFQYYRSDWQLMFALSDCIVATHCLKSNMWLRHTPYNQYAETNQVTVCGSDSIIEHAIVTFARLDNRTWQSRFATRRLGVNDTIDDWANPRDGRRSAYWGRPVAAHGLPWVDACRMSDQHLDV